MMTTYRLLCSIKTKSIAEPSRAALLDEAQIITYINCSLEKPETKSRGPRSKNQKKTLRIWLGGGDGAAWVDHAPPGGRVDGTSRSLTRPQPMAPPATDAASSWLGIAEMSRPLSGSRLDCWRCSVSVSTTLPSRRRRPYLLLIPRT